MPEAQPIDISRILSPTIPIWPGDTPFSKEFKSMLHDGDLVNLTTLTVSSHTGSHADAPYHVVDHDATIDQVNLYPYWGVAQLITVEKEDGPLFPEDLRGYDMTRAPRLLVRTPLAQKPINLFSEQYPYPSPALVELLQTSGIILYGTDAFSVDAFDSTTLPGHKALIAAGIAILEGLDLRSVRDGLYELVALPLRIAGGDGSPVRAALRPLS